MTTHEAKTHLSRLLNDVEAGEEVVICRGSAPVARLVPVTTSSAPRRPRVGTLTSAPVEVADGAFDPLEDAELVSWGI